MRACVCVCVRGIIKAIFMTAQFINSKRLIIIIIIIIIINVHKQKRHTQYINHTIHHNFKPQNRTEIRMGSCTDVRNVRNTTRRIRIGSFRLDSILSCLGWGGGRDA